MSKAHIEPDGTGANGKSLGVTPFERRGADKSLLLQSPWPTRCWTRLRRTFEREEAE